MSNAAHTTGCFLALFVICGGVLAQPADETASGPTDECPLDIEGTWDVDAGDGTLTMHQEEDRFTATLRFSSRDVVQFEGTVDGRSYTFSWTRRTWGISTAGTGELTLAADGTSLHLVMRNGLLTVTYDYEVDDRARTLTEA
jgi:outer membrane receptor protein involved in Fe transport